MSSQKPEPRDREIGTVLAALRSGTPGAAEALFPLVYTQLRKIAGSYFRGQSPEHTLQPTAVVHEAFLRLVRQSADGFLDRAHFIAVAALAMRQILVEHARGRGAAKRGGRAQRLSLQHPCVERQSTASGGMPDPVDILALEMALSRLQALAPRQARVVELQYFGGLTAEETAAVLGVSKSLVEKEWRRARAYLKSELAGATAPDADDGP